MFFTYHQDAVVESLGTMSDTDIHCHLRRYPILSWE